MTGPLLLDDMTRQLFRNAKGVEGFRTFSQYTILNRQAYLHFIASGESMLFSSTRATKGRAHGERGWCRMYLVVPVVFL
jgi:hypothetical protein